MKILLLALAASLLLINQSPSSNVVPSRKRSSDDQEDEERRKRPRESTQCIVGHKGANHTAFCDGKEDVISAIDEIPEGKGWCVNGNCYAEETLDTHLKSYRQKYDPMTNQDWFENGDIQPYLDKRHGGSLPSIELREPPRGMDYWFAENVEDLFPSSSPSPRPQPSVGESSDEDSSSPSPSRRHRMENLLNTLRALSGEEDSSSPSPSPPRSPIHPPGLVPRVDFLLHQLRLEYTVSRSTISGEVLQEAVRYFKEFLNVYLNLYPSEMDVVTWTSIYRLRISEYSRTPVDERDQDIELLIRDLLNFFNTHYIDQGLGFFVNASLRNAMQKIKEYASLSGLSATEETIERWFHRELND